MPGLQGSVCGNDLHEANLQISIIRSQQVQECPAVAPFLCLFFSHCLFFHSSPSLSCFHLSHLLLVLLLTSSPSILVSLTHRDSVVQIIEFALKLCSSHQDLSLKVAILSHSMDHSMDVYHFLSIFYQLKRRVCDDLYSNLSK